MTRIIDRLVDTLSAAILGIMSLVVATNVFCRFVLNFSLYWADELAMILMVWLTFIGAALAVRERSHYVLNFLINKLKGNTQRIFFIIQQGLTILSILLLLYFSALVAWQIRNWLMPATEISRSFVYSACPLGCLLMVYYSLRNLLEDHRDESITTGI